jgi:hypothetical protein
MKFSAVQLLALVAVIALGCTEVQAQTPCLDRCTKARVEDCEMLMMAGGKLIGECEEEKRKCDRGCRRPKKNKF